VVLFVLLFGTPLGLFVCLACGFPVVLLLERFGLNRVLFVGALGCVLGAVTGFWLAYPQAAAWPASAALAGVGALCGVVASRLSALVRSTRSVTGTHVARPSAL
jgi:hypothetical protein